LPSRERDEKSVKAMADLLRRGATLTNLACPACASPIFKLKSGELWCARCEKRVIVVKEGEEPLKATSPIILSTLETTLLTKIQHVQKQIQEETDIARLQKLNTILSSLLENLEKLRKVKPAQQ
jgi:UPF0148 protein